MAIHLLVDGYNLIRHSPTLSRAESHSLEQGRKALLDHLLAYKKAKGHRVTVVFDAGKGVISSEESYREKGIRVIFSGGGQTADDVIIRLARKEGERAVIVSSDRDLASLALRHGAQSVTSQEFELALLQASEGFEEESPEEAPPQSKIMSEKKGPARKLSKRLRKRRAKLAKL